MECSKEEKLLLKLSKLDWRKESTFKIDQNINIDTLLSLAASNSLLLYVVDRLKNLVPSNKVICEASERLSAFRMHILAKHAEFEHLQEKFVQSSISIIPIKGILLSRTLYPRLDLRDIADIDVIAGYNEAPKIASIMNKLKYKQVYADQKINKDLLPLLSDKDLRKYITCVEFVSSNSLIEIHFKLLSPKIFTQPSNEELMENTRIEKINDKDLLVLNPEYQLINLTTHATYHNLIFGLRSISEVDGLISYCSNNLDWDKFLKIINRNDLIQLCYPALSLSKLFYATAIPDSTMKAMKQNCSSLLVKLSERIGENFFERDKISVLNDHTHYFHVLSQKNRFKSLFRIVFPPIKMLKLRKGFIRNTFPFIYAEYPLRLLKLLYVYLPKIIKKTYYGLKTPYGRDN